LHDALERTAGSKLTLVPGEGPSFQFRLVDLEELGRRNGLLSFLGNSELKVGIGLSLTSLGAIDGRMDLQTDVKVLSGKEVRSARMVSQCSNEAGITSQ